MRRDTVIKLALEANGQEHLLDNYEFTEDQLLIFAGLVMDRCAAMCFAVAKQRHPNSEWSKASNHCGFSIRRDEPRLVVVDENLPRKGMK